jgi:hypothetical protein
MGSIDRLLTWEDAREIQASMRIEGFNISDERMRELYRDYLRKTGVQGDSGDSS